MAKIFSVVFCPMDLAASAGSCDFLSRELYFSAFISHVFANSSKEANKSVEFDALPRSCLFLSGIFLVF